MRLGRSSHGRWRRVIFCIGIASLAAGCVERRPVTDAALLDQLTLLDPGHVTRARVEARLGLPEQSFEAGTIGAYPVYRIQRHLVSRPPREEWRASYWLMVQYGLDEVLVRRSLVPIPSETP